MSRYLGPKVRLSRRLGVAIADIPKHTKFGTEFSAPGMHGFRSGRQSEYGKRMQEKQRMKAHYSVLEKQFRRYMAMAKKAKGNTAVTLQQLLETRLDNVVRRMGVVRTVWGGPAARGAWPREGQRQEGGRGELRLRAGDDDHL